MSNENISTSWPHLILDAIFPPRCAGQGENCEVWSRAVFCDVCVRTLQPIVPPFCAICGTPFRGTPFRVSQTDISTPNAPTNFADICAECRANRYHVAPPFDGLRSLYVFEGAARRAVHRLKYENKTALAKPLAALMSDYLGESSTRFVEREALTHIVAVPLHARRQRSRGYNQSELLARELSVLIGVSSAQLLLRTRDTTPQVELSIRDRAINVRDAFALNSNTIVTNTIVKGATILLIDDVHTTGATLRECARVLKTGGATKVYGLTLARAM